MEKKKLTSEETKKLALAAIIFAVGILFCFRLTDKVFSIIIGVSVIVAGVFYLINSIQHSKLLFTGEGIIGAGLVAFGLAFAVNSWTSIITELIPWALMAFGTMILIDSFLRLLLLKDGTTKFVLELIIGLATLSVGICLKAVPGFAAFTSLILGIVLIVYAVFEVVTVVFKTGKAK